MIADRFTVRSRRGAFRGALALALLLGLATGPAAEPPLTPVIVELFTSQGCSSCPPADTVLRSLERNQPVDGVVVVPLSEHVDYWNRLGWRDPFSSPRFSARQEVYAEALELPNLYTPMMVVDGQTAFVGSDGVAARDAITRAATRPKRPVSLQVAGVATSRVIELSASLGTPPAGRVDPVEVWLAVTETGLATDVRAGENMFRRLHHTGVVRHLERLATVARDRADRPITTRLRLDDDWNRDRLQVVVFLQQPATAAIVGAAAAPVG